MALDLPGWLIERIGRWQEAELQRLSAAGLRPVRPEALHVTVAFLGERPAGEIGGLQELIASLPSAALEGVLEPEALPLPRRRPRLLALGVSSPGAGALREELVEPLRRHSGWRPGARPYLPHVTVFRMRGRSGGGSQARVAALQEGDGQAFGFRRIALYRSDLRPEGAHYSALATNELPSP